MNAPAEPGPDGLLLVDKPAGVTSFAVVAHVRRALREAFPAVAGDAGGRRGKGRARLKCGHAGTLDPLATGLLLVLAGRSTRLAGFLLGLDKVYAATVRFGRATDTLDRDGAPLAAAAVPAAPAAVANALAAFRGRITQVPPVYSALKRDGRPLYELAREGRDPAPPAPREVTLSRLELVASRWDEAPPAGTDPAFLPADGRLYEVDLVVECSSGTYIRSLARDLARAAGSEGHLQALRRLRVGPFDIGGAVTGVLDRDGADLATALRPAAAALPHLPALSVDAARAAALRQGGQPAADWLADLQGDPVRVGDRGRLFRMLDDAGRLVAIGRIDETTGAPRLALVVPRENTRCD